MNRAAKDVKQELSNYLCVVLDKTVALVLFLLCLFQGDYKGSKHGLLLYTDHKNDFI